MIVTGFLHPGSMGASLAATARGERLWVEAGRSPATVERAREAQLTGVDDLAELCRRCDLIVSICPPDAAVEVAESVVAEGFEGRYLDANAIAPATAARIAELFGERYLDGGVIGPPARQPGTTRLYLSGPGASEVAERWAGSDLDARPLGEEAGDTAASALKMAYAGWTKGSSALLLAITALAQDAGVLDALRTEWDLSIPGLADRAAGSAAGASPKAWRWVGEMAEIAATFEAAGLSDGFHRAAGDTYARMAGFKDQPAADLDRVIGALLRADGGGGGA